jgi:hypothetical protein
MGRKGDKLFKREGAGVISAPFPYIESGLNRLNFALKSLFS